MSEQVPTNELLEMHCAHGVAIYLRCPTCMAERCIQFLLSPEGREAMGKAAAESEAFAAKLREARNIPWEKLHEPFTI